MEDYPRTQLDLERRFATEEACRQYLAGLRWPNGFLCPRCGERDAWLRSRGLWLCRRCRRETSVTAGTLFQDSHLPLTTWFRALWLVTSQKHGASALGVQRALGLGSYKTAWTLLHKLRHAMVRPGRDRLAGTVEVDETTWGGHEPGVRGRRIEQKAVLLVAAQHDGPRIGRIRLRCVPNLTRATIQHFLDDSVEPGSLLVTDGLSIYRLVKGYRHECRVIKHSGHSASDLLPHVHRVISLLKRWLLGTHQGAVDHAHLDDYLDEFTFRFNRRTSRSRGKLFYRLLQHAVQLEPQPYRSLTSHHNI